MSFFLIKCISQKVDKALLYKLIQNILIPIRLDGTISIASWSWDKALLDLIKFRAMNIMMILI